MKQNVDFGSPKKIYLTLYTIEREKWQDTN